MYKDTVEVTGCHMSEYDTDEDGVNGDLIYPTGNDQCPFTSNSSIQSGFTTFGTLDTFGCWYGDDDSDEDGYRLYEDACPDTSLDLTAAEKLTILSEGELRGCSAYQRDEDGDGVMTAMDECLDTPAGESVEKTGKYAGCSLDERVERGDTSAVLQKNMVWIILAIVVVVLMGVILTVTILRRGQDESPVESTWQETQPMHMGYEMPTQAAPVATVAPVAPITIPDYTQLPGGGGYVTGAMGETIYNAPDGSAWQMNADGSFTRIQ